jgi:hypothetical protein
MIGAELAEKAAKELPLRKLAAVRHPKTAAVKRLLQQRVPVGNGNYMKDSARRCAPLVSFSLILSFRPSVCSVLL